MIVELILSVRAERKGLEEIAMPLTAADAEAEAGSGPTGRAEGSGRNAGPSLTSSPRRFVASSYDPFPNGESMWTMHFDCVRLTLPDP
ncbi:MAG: hypothetical protein WBW80_21695 [Acidimicrobiales bacterium]